MSLTNCAMCVRPAAVHCPQHAMDNVQGLRISDLLHGPHILQAQMLQDTLSHMCARHSGRQSMIAVMMLSATRRGLVPAVHRNSTFPFPSQACSRCRCTRASTTGCGATCRPWRSSSRRGPRRRRSRCCRPTGGARAAGRSGGRPSGSPATPWEVRDAASLQLQRQLRLAGRPERAATAADGWLISVLLACVRLSLPKP